MKTECGFEMAWIGPCKEDRDACEHAQLKCSSCGKPATHSCDKTMGLICGAPLCDECEHTICENGCNSGAPLPEGYKEHCKKSDQVYKPWYVVETEAIK